MGSSRAPLGDRECFAASWVDGILPGSLWTYGVDTRGPVVHGDDSKITCTDTECPTLSFTN